MSAPKTPESSPKPEARIRCTDWLGILFQSVSFSDFCHLLAVLSKHFSQPLLIALLKCQYALVEAAFKFRLRLSELRIVVNRAHVTCLKRGYLAPDERNLTSQFWYRCSVSDHPIQCINVFLECYHNRKRYLPNDADQRPGATDLRMSTRAPSPGSLHLACSAVRSTRPEIERVIGWLRLRVFQRVEQTFRMQSDIEAGIVRHSAQERYQLY